MGDKFDPQVFFSQAEHVALHVDASEVFGLLTRSLDLPSQWAALVTRKTGDQVAVPAGGRVEAGEVVDLLFARVSPLEVVVEEENLVCRDRFHCRARVKLWLSLVSERGELSSFLKNVLGSRRVAKVEAVSRYVRPSLRTALVRLAAERDASELVGAGSTDAVSTALAEALKGPCFAAGLTLQRPPTARFESPTLREVQRTEERSVRRRAEHQATRELQEALEGAQSKHLDHLASLLARLKDAAAGSPDVELPELIRTFSEQQRGELYQALFATGQAGSRTRWVVVAAGEELLYFDAESFGEPSRRLSLTGPIGGVRSIQTAYDDDGRVVLLLGAATGVYRLPIDRAEPDLTLVVADPPTVRGGVNAVAMVGVRFFASHSELGLREWSSNQPASAKPRFESMTRGAKAVRGVCFHDGDLYCSIDDRIIRWPADDDTDSPSIIYTGSDAAVTVLCPTSDGLFAGNSDGDVLYWPTGRHGAPERLHTGGQRATESLWLLSSHGVRRLVFADTSLCVHARVVGDSFSCRYEAVGQTLRRVEVADDLLVATNDLRDRLICWVPGDPNKPTATIGVSAICGRSIQDVCLVPHA